MTTRNSRSIFTKLLSVLPTTDLEAFFCGASEGRSKRTVEKEMRGTWPALIQSGRKIYFWPVLSWRAVQFNLGLSL
jgi:hypothetical protein